MTAVLRTCVVTMYIVLFMLSWDNIPILILDTPLLHMMVRNSSGREDWSFDEERSQSKKILGHVDVHGFAAEGQT